MHDIVPTKVFSNFKFKENKQILLFACIKNEAHRLNYFIKYYKDLGVDHFFFCDNNSNDNTKKILSNFDFVTLYEHKGKYNEYNSGKDWTDFLRNKYGLNKWCLTLDLDEFLVYENSENIKLPYLTSVMESEGSTGMASILLDHYSNNDLNAISDNNETNLFVNYPYFDKALSYKVFKTNLFPFYQVKGGPRKRIFWTNDTYKNSPSQKKIPLIYMTSKFEYYYSTHSCSEIILSSINSVLAHFKFLNNFQKFVDDEIKSKTRTNHEHYLIYSNKIKTVKNFFSKEFSVFFESSQSYIKEGYLTRSPLLSIDEIENLENNTVSYDNFVKCYELYTFKKYSESDSISINDQHVAKRLLKLKTLKLTKKIREFLVNKKLISSKNLFEVRLLNNIIKNKSNQINIIDVYESFWWSAFSFYRFMGYLKKKFFKK